MIKRCEICGRDYVARRSTAKYCSNRCRLMAQRGVEFRGKVTAPVEKVGLSSDEVASIVSRAHDTASDLSRASMLTEPPLSHSLKVVSRKLADALSAEGL